jgi:hypothetical protein
VLIAVIRGTGMRATQFGSFAPVGIPRFSISLKVPDRRMGPASEEGDAGERSGCRFRAWVTVAFQRAGFPVAR